MTTDYHTALEEALFRTLNADGGRALDLVFLLLSSRAFGILFGVAVVGLIAACAKERRLPLLLAFALALLLSDTVGAQVLKPLFGRMRPCFALPAQKVRLLGAASDVGSLPSLHASNFFTMATIAVRANRRAGAVGLVIAALVALSRIYLGVHWPTDVLCGAAWGVLCAYVATRLTRNAWTSATRRAKRRHGREPPTRPDALPRA